MARQRSGRLRKIVSLADAEERRYAAMTGESQRALDEQRTRLGELTAYRQSYTERSREVTTASGAQWRDYQTFISKLEQAQRGQQQIVQDAERALAAHRQRWLAKRQRLESLQKVLNRCCEEEQLQLDRREQRRLDELPATPSIFEDD